MCLFDEEEILKSYIRSERYEVAQEAAQKAEKNKARKIAGHLIKTGKISLENIAEATELPVDVVKELEKEIMQENN